jgi:hypothetical protein
MMAITKLHKFLIHSRSKNFSAHLIFWLSLSLSFSFIYGLMALQQGFRSEYVVQDDVRQHVFWMQRFLDAKLFPNDLIADYFQSVAPAGYKAVYQLPAALGINPMVLNKWLPMVLGMITTGYCFGVSMQLLPVPATGFIATLVLNQNLWIKDDLVSATPRAFVYPLFLAFLYYLLRRNLLGVGVAIALLGLFYPQCVFICAGILILRLWRWDNWRLRLTQNRADFVLSYSGLGVAFLILLPFALAAAKFSPVITLAEAKELPEFYFGGRSIFFHKDPLIFWINGERSGMFPKTLFTPVTLCAGLILPLLMRFSSKFPLVRQVTEEVAILPQIFIASAGMFFAAHAVLFKLHLPSRYTGHTFRIIIALASAIAISTLLDTILRWAIEKGTPNPSIQSKIQNPKSKIVIALAATLLIGILLIGYPSFVKKFPITNYRVGMMPTLYEFFQKTPKDTLIASLADEANNLPSFAQRSILVGREYAIPYHMGYYRQFRQRTLDLIHAQYSPNLAEVKTFIQKYGIDFWLLAPGAFTPDYVKPKRAENNRWIQQYQPAANEALANLQQGKIPALSKLIEPCKVFEAEGFVVLQADCLVNH